MSCTEHYHITRAYRKTATGADVLLDIYPPPSLTGASNVTTTTPKIPALIHFHGGGIVVGNRKSFLPPWIMNRVFSAGWAFISADYHLITPPTAHDIKQDVIDLFKFLVDAEFDVEVQLQGEGATASGTGDTVRFGVDAGNIVVAGSSGGGLPAYMAAGFAVPRPKALLNVYAMGGNFLLPFYVKPKTEPFFPGEPLLDISQHRHFIHPFPSPLPIETDIFVPSPPPPDWHIRSNIRTLTIQLGNWVDHYTGLHNPSLSSVLQSKLLRLADNKYLDTSNDHDHRTEALEALIPTDLQHLFPQIHAKLSGKYKESGGIISNDNDNRGWPPTVLIHGTADTAVLFEESGYMKDVLEGAAVRVELLVAEGQDHAFDYGPGVEEEWGWMFDRAFGFVRGVVEGVVEG